MRYVILFVSIAIALLVGAYMGYPWFGVVCGFSALLLLWMAVLVRQSMVLQPAILDVLEPGTTLKTWEIGERLKAQQKSRSLVGLYQALSALARDGEIVHTVAGFETNRRDMWTKRGSILV